MCSFINQSKFQKPQSKLKVALGWGTECRLQVKVWFPHLNPMFAFSNYWGSELGLEFRQSLAHWIEIAVAIE